MNINKTVTKLGVLKINIPKLHTKKPMNIVIAVIIPIFFNKIYLQINMIFIDLYAKMILVCKKAYNFAHSVSNLKNDKNNLFIFSLIISYMRQIVYIFYFNI